VVDWRHDGLMNWHCYEDGVDAQWTESTREWHPFLPERTGNTWCHEKRMLVSKN